MSLVSTLFAPGALVAASLLCACDTAPNGSSEGTPDYATGTHLVLLGTGNPNANPDKSGPAVAVVVDGKAYIVDAGPGVVRRAAAAARKGIDALSAPNLGIVFLTHLHHDHTLGLPDLMFTPWTLERDVPLEVDGPPGVEEMTRHLTAAYAQDIRMRVDGLEPANTEGYKVNAHDIRDAGVVYADDRVEVTAFPVTHGSWEYAFGYRFVSADRTIVISGDATKSESIVEYCQACDILVHEVYAQAGFEQREPEWQRYHAAFHTSSHELAELATRARPKLLVLYHEMLWGATVEELLAEIATGWDGEVVYGEDLDVY